MSKKRLLVVDDDPIVVKTIIAILKKEHYGVITAKDGEACVKKAIKEKPDLIILDLMMPGMNGFQVCKILKDNEKTRTIPILMLTASEKEKDLCKGLEQGVCCFISKPFNAVDLLDEVTIALTKNDNAVE